MNKNAPSLTSSFAKAEENGRPNICVILEVPHPREQH
jgi:hypothetical protein